MKLSHSSLAKYTSCGYKWHLYYQKRLKDPNKSSALHFGDCLDKAINAMLLDHKNKGLKPLELYIQYFKNHFEVIQLSGNAQKVSAVANTAILYYSSDFDADLLFGDDLATLKDQYKKEDVVSEFKKIRAMENVPGLTISNYNKQFLNAVYWHVLKNKAISIISKYYEDILPTIKEVLEIQTKVELSDGHGGEIVGYVDAILDFGNGPVICDLKTSSREYASDSASNSEQLALYVHCLKDKYATNKTAFIVAQKTPKKIRKKICKVCEFIPEETSRHKSCFAELNGKRCGGDWDELLNIEAKIDIIPGEIPEVFESVVVENYDNVLRSIEASIFTKNWGNCEAFNRKCEYYNYCRKGDKKGLVQE